MKKFVRDATLLFLALRAGDLVNLAAGMWFVPKYVSPQDIGAVLPVSSFATFLSLPVFAFAMAVMKETAVLAERGERGRIKTLLCGVFLATAAMIVLTMAITAAVLPRFMGAMRIENSCAGFLVVAAAFLGCTAPVWTDALQALKRFRALAAIEVGAAAGRFAAMVAIMPAKALIGFFAGQATLPVLRIVASTCALRKELTCEAQPFWNKSAIRRMLSSFAAILVYQGIAMFTSMLELSILRTALADTESAGYYMVSRFSDFLHYLTLPVLLVLFPYTAAAASRGESTRPFVAKSSLAVLCAASAMAGVYLFAGEELLSLMPNGKDYVSFAHFMPILTISTALVSCQVFHTNTEVSAGRFSFLRWFVPLHLAYAAFLHFAHNAGILDSTGRFIACFAVAGAARFLFAAIHLRCGRN